MGDRLRLWKALTNCVETYTILPLFEKWYKGKYPSQFRTKWARECIIVTDIYLRLELLSSVSWDLCLVAVWQSLWLQVTLKARAPHQNWDLLVEPLERCQILFGPKTVDSRTEECTWSLQCSTHQPPYCRIYEELPGQHSMHFRLCLWVAHLHDRDIEHQTSTDHFFTGFQSTPPDNWLSGQSQAEIHAYPAL